MNGNFLRSCQTSQIVTIFLGIDRALGQTPNTLCLLAVAARLLIFIATMIGKLLVFKVTMEQGERDENRTNLNTKNLTFFTEIQPFFLNKYSLG